MKKNILINPDIFPDEKVLKKYLGNSFILFKRILDYTHSQIPDVEEVWNFYRDGNSWLLRLTKKSKTYFWISIFDSSFCTTFYLNSTAENKIMTSDLSNKLKEQYASTKDRKIRWISLEINQKEDLDNFIILLEIKGKLK